MNARDLRHLVPPQPMEIILEDIESLQAGQALAYILPHHPVPLFPLLNQAGVQHQCSLTEDGGVLITLTRT
ncbi:hypothetical protein THUN1379_28930 [Paludibacterium sp. THUN1379]|uniref:DUF2249 domain-containing protein n=1 Tax=Paludibacterium sp. THUN1379 TaxID=3112107 RepID=UPI00308530E1|nr:hypothetical protein THUN1379_28930 [Paludibacterium sp. THUN1379]